MLGGRDQFEDVDVRLLRFDRPDAPTNEQATAHLRITVKDPDPRKVGRRFSNATMELALGGYAGFHTTTPPTPESAYGVYWPTLVPAAEVAAHRGAARRHSDPRPTGCPRPSGPIRSAVPVRSLRPGRSGPARNAVPAGFPSRSGRPSGRCPQRRSRPIPRIRRRSASRPAIPDPAVRPARNAVPGYSSDPAAPVLPVGPAPSDSSGIFITGPNAEPSPVAPGLTRRGGR